MLSGTHEFLDVSSARPLTLPEELWRALSPAEQAVYRRAEALLDSFSARRNIALSRLLEQGPRAEVMRALHVLGGMELIHMEPGDRGPVVELRALPDEHVPVTGPDGKKRWLFVARPVNDPELEASQLN
jgi:hypothetical protein